MRSRSSRLFIILLHLFGVSIKVQNNPLLKVLFPNSQLRNGVGILGVNPLRILLEPLELQAAGGLDELLSALEKAGYDVEKTILWEPYWLQDDSDGKCLGPVGFSECGDTTLWMLRRRLSSPTSRKRKRSSHQQEDSTHHYIDYIPFIWRQPKNQQPSTQEEKWEYALELVDPNSLSSSTEDNHHLDSSSSRTTGSSADCLISSSDGRIETGSCKSSRAWLWRIDKSGVLAHVLPPDNEANILDTTKRNGLASLLFGGSILRLMGNVRRGHVKTSSQHYDDLSNTPTTTTQSMCVWRSNVSTAITSTCDKSSILDHPTTDDENNVHPHDTNLSTLVSFSVVQYQNSAPVSPKLPRFRSVLQEDESIIHRNDSSLLSLSNDDQNVLSFHYTNESQNNTDNYNNNNNNNNKNNHLPRSSMASQIHAASPFLHATIKQTSSGPQLNNRGSIPSSKSNLLLQSSPSLYNIQSRASSSSSSSSSPLAGVGMHSNRGTTAASAGGKLLYHPPQTTGSAFTGDDSPLHRPRKIPVHPYIAASKDGIYYEDPDTGLKYLTDLSDYLGHDRTVSGRHTLMGVGLYTRTMLKIKIYGVALYVPKRDVLSDANVVPFASMDAEELRSCDEFYNYLMGMGPDNTSQQQHFDRTLLIKLNMQLSVETIRSSLAADWKLLSEEDKNMLTQSSFKERPADEAMLKKIQSPDNPSKCSCGQVAPAEYEADPSCCARETELVFTWLKNGDLELRVDGRLIDTFSSPDMAKGIFYEYMRGDDPISFDARNHFADGWPFLLAPLAQVKGVTYPKLKQEEVKTPVKKNPFDIGKSFIYNAFDAINHQTVEVSSWVGNSVHGLVTGLSQTAQRASQSPQHIWNELEKNRVHLWNQALMFVNEPTGFISSRMFMMMHRKSDMSTPYNDSFVSVLSNTSKISDVLSPEIKMLMGESSTITSETDEIGVIIEPCRNFSHVLFLYTVHLYLMLLLIISVPDSQTTRLVVKRLRQTSSVSTLDSESDNEERNYCEIERDLSMENLLYESKDDPINWSKISTQDHELIPRVVIQRRVHSEEDDYRFPPANGNSHAKMKKALSYFL